MDSFNKHKLLWIVAIFTAFNAIYIASVEIIVRKSADKVIQRFQKDYSPSPYGPGLDPDKINPKPKNTNLETHKAAWREAWEEERGF